MPEASRLEGDTTATVYVVDDDISFLRSVSRLLKASGFRVATYTSASEFLAELNTELPGCVISDLMMPETDGIALQEALEARGHPLPIIFLTGHGDIPTSVQAIRRGAEDFLTKYAPKAQLLDAIHRGLARNDRERKERVSREGVRKAFAQLTDRELQVLTEVLKGKLNKQIAADLQIHERTVKLHRTNITRKLKVHSVAELTIMAQQAGVARWAESR